MIFKQEDYKIVEWELVMSVTHAKAKRLKSGAKRRKFRDKIKAELGRQVLPITIAPTIREVIKTRGKTSKTILRKADEINVFDPKTGKTTKTKILTVVENPANRHYVRMNVITRGAIVKTELGNARITSKPGQHGVVNGVLI